MASFRRPVNPRPASRSRRHDGRTHYVTILTNIAGFPNPLCFAEFRQQAKNYCSSWLADEYVRLFPGNSISSSSSDLFIRRLTSSVPSPSSLCHPGRRHCSAQRPATALRRHRLTSIRPRRLRVGSTIDDHPFADILRMHQQSPATAPRRSTPRAALRHQSRQMRSNRFPTLHRFESHLGAAFRRGFDNGALRRLRTAAIPHRRKHAIGF